jgi:WD40 repeat protein
VCVWDAMTGTCVHELRHADAGGVVASLSFSPSGSLLLSTGADPDGAVRVWDVATGGLVAAATCDAPVAASAWLPRGAKTAFVTAGADGVKCWRVSVVEEDADESDAATSEGDDDSSDEASRKTAPPNTKYVVADPVPFPFDAASDAASVSELTSTGDPVCTALCVAENGAVYTGDSRGRVWRAAPVDDLDASSAPALALCAKALPELEAVTALACVGATGAKLFVGSSKRARVWEHAMRGKGWEEVGELELDGAVVTAAFSGGAAESSEYEPSRDCDGSDSSSSLPGKPVGIVTTSAGSAWLVDVSTGTARALAQAHPRAIASVSLSAIGSRVALATVDVDGAARVWDAESSAKVIEVFSEEKNEKKPTRASVVATSPNGGHVCLGCEDGSIGVVRVGSDSRPGGSRRRSESRSSSVSGPVKRVRAHASDSGGVVCVAFVPPALVAPKGIDLTPLLSVARDGTIAVTQTHVAEADAASFVPSSLVRVVENDRGGGETASHTTPFAWCTPFLKKDFSRRHSSPPALPFQPLFDR